jgi:hypothetical protein
MEVEVEVGLVAGLVVCIHPIWKVSLLSFHHLVVVLVGVIEVIVMDSRFKHPKDFLPPPLSFLLSSFSFVQINISCCFFLLFFTSFFFA